MPGRTRSSLVLFLAAAVTLVFLLTLAPPAQAQQVTYPTAAGVIWHRGETQVITWSGFTGEFVKIELLRKGSLVATLATITRNTGSFSWRVPTNMSTSNRYSIRITAVSSSGSADVSDREFTIMGPVVTVTTPNGGQTWRFGDTRSIRWTTSAPGGTVRIQLFKAGKKVLLIANNAVNNSNFSWLIPTTLTKSSQYRIHIVSNGTEHPEDFSNADFAIKPPSLTITYPNESTVTWKRQGIYDITWTNLGNPGSRVRLDLYRGNSKRICVSTSAPNTGSFSWVVPRAISGGSDYRIRIMSLNHPDYSDFSDQPFTISEELLPSCRIFIETPTGDPTASTTTLVGTSEVVFSDTGVPDVLTVRCQFRVQSGLLTGINNKVRACISDVDDSTLQWIDPATGATSNWTGVTNGRPTGANTVMGQAVYNPANGFFEIDAVYTGLPTRNTGFGPKTVWAQIVDGTDVLAQDDQPIEVFYAREGTGNPMFNSGTRDDGPNWYYYWKTGGAVTVTPITGVIPTAPVVLPGWEYDIDPFSYGFYMLGEDHVNVCDLVAQMGNDPLFTLTNKYTGVTISIGSAGIGAYLCGQVVAHEFLHKKYYDDWTALIAAAEVDGELDADPYDDPDDDMIPNAEEPVAEGISSNPGDPDTYDMDAYISGYASYGDNEIRCRKRQLTPSLSGVSIDESLDWSWPGANSVPPFTYP